VHLRLDPYQVHIQILVVALTAAILVNFTTTTLLFVVYRLPAVESLWSIQLKKGTNHIGTDKKVLKSQVILLLLNY
jgi:hypothetical protein